MLGHSCTVTSRAMIQLYGALPLASERPGRPASASRAATRSLLLCRQRGTRCGGWCWRRLAGARESRAAGWRATTRGARQAPDEGASAAAGCGATVCVRAASDVRLQPRRSRPRCRAPRLTAGDAAAGSAQARGRGRHRRANRAERPSPGFGRRVRPRSRRRAGATSGLVEATSVDGASPPSTTCTSSSARLGTIFSSELACVRFRVEVRGLGLGTNTHVGGDDLICEP